MGEGHGGQYITLYEAKELMTTQLLEYEAKVIVPRHRETQDSIERVEDAVASVERLVQQGTGAVKLAGVLGSLASILWIILQILTALKK